MIVTDIRRIDDKRYCLYIDYEPYASVYSSDIRRLQLRVGEEVDEVSIKEFRKEYLFRRALNKAVNSIKFSDKCEYDIRKKLIERGVPESEVRFIHEADTDVKKKELFQKTRKGEVRVLLGSTQKMGAGTNVQDRLIALHDVDCPWRPSDLEQRSGRIIRQGNSNPDVDIYRYVTEQTFDAYLYQLVEGKQKFASQIMTSKSPVRSAEDIDETALSYA